MPEPKCVLDRLEQRVDELTGRISGAFPAVSSRSDDPMIDGLGALSELEDVLADLIAGMKALEEIRDNAYKGGRYHRIASAALVLLTRDSRA